MKIKTLRKIRLLLGILSVVGLSFVVYSIGISNTDITMAVSAIVIMLCIAGIVVTCIVRWKEIEEGPS